jgi:hypothetical protein
MKFLPKLKPLVPLLLLTLLLPACSSQPDQSPGLIAWKPYAEGVQAASSQGKKVFLYFRADW